MFDVFIARKKQLNEKIRYVYEQHPFFSLSLSNFLNSTSHSKVLNELNGKSDRLVNAMAVEEWIYIMRLFIWP